MTDAKQDEIRDLQSNVALSMLTDLMKQGKINSDQCDAYKRIFQKLHDTVVQTFQNHHFLWERAKKLKTQQTTEKANLETAVNDQAIAQEKAQQLNANLKKTEDEYDIQERKNDLLQIELDDIEHEKSNINLKIQEQEKFAKSKAAPELERYDQEIDGLKQELIQRKNQIETEQQLLQSSTDLIAQYKNDNDDQLTKISKLHDELLKIKDDPVRYSKNADMLQSANKIMLKDLQGYQEDIAKKDKTLADLNSEYKHLQTKLGEYETQIEEEKNSIEKSTILINKYSEEFKRLREQHNDQMGEKIRKEIDMRALEMEIRRHKDKATTYRKQTEQDKKVHKKESIQKNMINDQLYVLKMTFENIKKEQYNLKYEREKETDIGQTVKDENNLLTQKLKNVYEKTQEKQSERQSIYAKIKEAEQQVLELQKTEADNMKRVKALTATRESMARKASSALAEVRETREELKIKELLILDLTKKHQETEVRLNNYKSLYEEVKQARNKYVNMIQNSSQDLAELKERIKILQNELEILKNESQEKERTLLEYRHILQVEVHKKDRTHAKLNKLEYQKKAKKEIVDQNINEIEKLNMIIMSLEKDMLTLRKQYEQVCESRNFTGIQLIDRNDELCILYEKCNIQDNILKSGELEIKRLEDEIRMIKIEIQEQKRKIDVARKQIILVPQMAERVIQLKNELELEKKREMQLSEDLENPQNKKRFRELDGEDPDQEALDAKIHVLEERLNNKKEQLLEKELILDEITNLSEKLRKQALDGRLTTLELSEKVNEFQTKLKDLTRKMMATIAELSIYQGSAINLQREKEELEKIAEESKERFMNGLPPQPQDELEYLKQQKYKLRYEEERKDRLERQEYESQFKPYAVKTTAKQRLTQYIPEDGTGIPLPKNYGKSAPFYPQDQSANMRFYKKPKVKEIEI